MKTRLLTAVVLLCLPHVVSAGSVAASVEAVQGAKLGASSKVNNLTISTGHLRLVFASGSAALLTTPDGPVGIYVKGAGTAEYSTADANESPLVANNVKADTHLRFDRGKVSGDISEVLLYSSGEALPALGGADGDPLADAYAAVKKVLAVSQIEPPAFGVVEQKTSFPSGKYVSALIVGRDRLLYELDTDDAQAEGLSVLLAPGVVGDSTIEQQLYPRVVSRQPVGRDAKTYAKPPFILTAVDYTLVGDGDNAKLEVTETITPRVTGLTSLRMDLTQAIFVAPRKPQRSERLRSIVDGEGRKLSFDHDHGSLLIGLAAPAAQPFQLKFTIDGDFLVREGGDNAWQLGTDEWLPLPRSLAQQAYTVHSLVRVRKPFVPVAPGRTVSRREEGDYNVAENVIDKPVQFAVVEAGKYTPVEETRGELTIRVWAYALKNDRAAKQLANIAFGLIDYYQYFLGPFPWKEFNIVQINDYGFGQAPPAMMFITNEAFNPIRPSDDGESTSADQFFSQGINERFAHEIAHQYWGYVVKMPSSEEQWLSEAFAEYSAALALKKLKNEAAYNRLVSTWRGNGRTAAGVAPIPYANRIGGDRRTAFSNRTWLLYDKGPYLLYTLNKQVGDEVFMTFLKSYQKSFAWKFGTTNDVAGLLGYMTKKDWKPFFDQYYWGTAMPQ
jgi:hypothetical protein